MKIIKNLKTNYSKMSNTEKIIYGLFIVSFIVPIIGDVIYGAKANAESYMFGSFLSNLSVAVFSLFNVIIVLYVLIYFIFKKIIPCFPKYIEDNIKKNGGKK